MTTPGLTKVYNPCKTLLGGSGVVISRVISPLIWVISISIVTLLITLLIITHEPPSRDTRLQAGASYRAESKPHMLSSTTTSPTRCGSPKRFFAAAALPFVDGRLAL